MFSVITAFKLTQTLSLTSLNFSTTLLLRRFFTFFRYNYNESEQDQKMNDDLWRSASSRSSNDHESIRHGEDAPHDKYNNAAAHSSANETSGRHPTVMQWNLQVDPNSQQVR